MTRANRGYNDPVKARLTVVEELKPNQWAGVVSVVAHHSAAGGWTEEETRQVLAMLGIDRDRARGAKEALRRSRRLKLIYASTPTPKTALRPRTGQPGAVSGPLVVAAPARHGRRDKRGHFTRSEVCLAGLHEMTPENTQRRADRTSVQCRKCISARRARRRREQA